MEADAAALERMRSIFSTYQSDVLRYVQRRIAADAASDVVSEVFLVAWRRLPEIPTDPLPWLYGVARRVLSNHRRALERQVRLARHVAGAGGLGLRAAATSQVEDHVTSSATFAAAFYRLSDDDREVLMLIAWEGLSARDVAIALGCSVPAMTTRLYRARRRLRDYLDEQAKEI